MLSQKRSYRKINNQNKIKNTKTEKKYQSHVEFVVSSFFRISFLINQEKKQKQKIITIFSNNKIKMVVTII